ncbi:MAG: hypothetical protein V3V08_06350 [Nannocystaceae bacterium]
MPGLCGTKFVELLRREGLENAPGVLLMSSCDEEQLRRLAEAHGADAYLTKSADRHTLFDAVRLLLDDQRGRTGTDR